MTPAYRLQWLGPRDARAVARLEAALFDREQRTGARDLREQLAVAERAGENLSIGLYRGRRLLGYCMMFVEQDRRRICAYTGLPPPVDSDFHGPGIYVVDVAVHPDHRDQSWQLLRRAAAVIESRADLRHLPREGLCTQALLPFWQARRRTLRRIGFSLVKATPVCDPDTGATVYWLRFDSGRPTREGRLATPGVRSLLGDTVTHELASGECTVGVVRSAAGWSSLRDDWECLCSRTPGATVFCSYAYLRAWWEQLGLAAEPYLVVALDADGSVRAIAPMQIMHRPGPGANTLCLGFMGMPSEVDRPTVLAAEGDVLSPSLIADYLVGHHGVGWRSSILYEQNPDSVFYQAMRKRLSGLGMLVESPEGPVCPMVEVQGTFDAYLASRSKAQRKSYRRHRDRLRQVGALTMDTIDSDADEAAGLSRYLAVEQASWKAGSSVGVARSSAHLGFLHALMGMEDPRPQLQVRVLVLDGEDIAATLGLYWQRCLYSMHIAHSRAWEDYSPGFVLTGMELEEIHARGLCERVDYLGGFLSNKRGWATHYRETRALFAHPPDAAGLAYHAYHFRCRPWLRRCLVQLDLLDTAIRIKRLLGQQGRFA